MVQSRSLRRGIAVSPGVAVGTAYCLEEIFVSPDTKRLEDREVSAELARYEHACDRAAADLRALQHKVEQQVGKNEAAIFGMHESILRDPAFRNKIRTWIVDERLGVQAALHRLLDEYTLLFARTKDQYLKERLTDLRDVVVRLSAHLTEVLHGETPVIAGPLIIAADELLPSQAVALGDTAVAAIVTESGSQTSHAAIIARSRGIPAVAGVAGLLRQLKTGDAIIVDGREGTVIIKPDAESLSAYRKLEREFVDLKDQLATNRDTPARTANGKRIKLLANINNVADARAAKAMGADGVGLYRTEYLYLTHPDVPDEDEQLAVYRSIIDESPRHHVTIRTLDIGGDKTIPYLGHDHQEANPFLGWRSIRISFEHQPLFLTQIRAILRAAAHAKQLGGQVRLMFPMVTIREEFARIRTIVRKAEQQLTEEEKEFARVPVGMMIEVPAAAIAIDLLLEVTDFVSIGSNDLVQYLMAADRDNPKVNHLCQPLNPAVLRTLKNVIQACVEAKKPVTLCGEMAGQPR
ncbi:MAG: phosphoenolpyruvate--protein phosphotransferase, partial [Planctomycetales bacterium]|nr:phosphoenolpyruvate--protein phosphotransferase [Planctomycetales bacterium]